MGALEEQRYVSEEEFWELVETQEVRLERIGGHIYAMAGGGLRHSQLMQRLGGLLDSQLRRKRCSPAGSEIHVKVEATGDYFIPDNSIFCEEPRFERRPRLALLNPAVVFEVLSASTEKYDRSGKFDLYARIPSLEHYVLIFTEWVRVEHYTRRADGWLLKRLIQLDDILNIPDVEVEVSLRELYEDFDIPVQLTLLRVEDEE